MLHRIEHDTHNRIDIVRRCSIFHIFNSKFSGNGRTNLVNVEPYSFNLRRMHHIISQVLCHSMQLAVKTKRAQPAVKQTLFTEYFFLKE